MLVEKEIITLVDWVNIFQITENTDGSLRLCIDPIHSNKVITKEMYTIPILEELAPKLSHKKCYTGF